MPLTVGYRRFTCKGAMEGTCGAQKTSKVWRFTYLEAGIQLDTNGNNPEPFLTKELFTPGQAVEWVCPQTPRSRIFSPIPRETRFPNALSQNFHRFQCD